MTIRLPLTLPAITPTTWELRLPDYPVITGAWRSSAFPEILGSLPSGAEWGLRFENVSDAQALALLLPWRATAGGLWPLTALPAELAGGVNNDDFRKRLTGTTWTIAREPKKESVKNGRFNVTIDLVHELTLESIYGPRASAVAIDEVPLLLRIAPVLEVMGLPVAVDKTPRREAQAVLYLELVSTLEVLDQPTAVDKAPRVTAADLLLLGLSSGLEVMAVPTSLDKTRPDRPAQAVIDMNITPAMEVVGVIP